jgi:hypothetical protein
MLVWLLLRIHFCIYGPNKIGILCVSIVQAFVNPLHWDETTKIANLHVSFYSFFCSSHEKILELQFSMFCKHTQHPTTMSDVFRQQYVPPPKEANSFFFLFCRFKNYQKKKTNNNDL